MQSSTSLLLRKATIDDFPNFFSLFEKSLKELFPQYTKNTIAFFIEADYSQKFLEEQIKLGRKSVYIAEIDGKPVAYLLVSKNYGGVGHANWLAVVPEHQKKGLAHALLTSWEKDVVKNGGHALQVWTSEKNLAFYKKCGYSVAGHFPNSWFGLGLYLLYKNLGEAKEENFLREYLQKKQK